MTRNPVWALAGLVVLFGLSWLAAAEPHKDHEHGITDGVCVLAPTKGNTVTGTLTLTQKGKGVVIAGEVKGLTPGDHGFHIHMFGDLRDESGASAGGHYNPDGHEHGGPHSPNHHAGDLGNIKAGADGVAKVEVEAKGVELHHILGRSLVVHAKADDLKSQPAGDSGPRVAVGVIGLAEVKPAAK